ncbi:hypothetical protein QBC46DRAFT_346409 [Diplogelasinospora grovesii]|uniref:Uncharacterized protein n=1 Tax=Diplogelasinospora grovesii TaxID=303347 RepID=A0AAN6MY27_9PEZI|nr:hypothetical protein QBC46DRAFT_346409 [Diplogelasinospora grovesii]
MPPDTTPHPAPPRNVTAGDVGYTPHPPGQLVDVPPHRQAIKQAITNLYCGSASERDMAVYAERVIYDGPFRGLKAARWGQRRSHIIKTGIN